MSLLLRMCRLQHTCMCSGPLNTVLPVPQVAMLFRSHKDLLEEFTYFLPDAQAPAQVLLAPPHTWRTLILYSAVIRMPKEFNASKERCLITAVLL